MNYLTNKKIYLIFIPLALFLIFVRFSYPLPVMYADDSVKYSIPLQVIYSQYFKYILETPHFSFLAKYLAYFVQHANKGDISFIIVIQKISSILASLIVFLLSYEISKQRFLALALALAYGLNPQLLFIEQLIMPESYFLFFGVLASYLFYRILKTEDVKVYSLLSVFFGLSMVLAELSKESGSICLKSTLLVSFLLSGLTLNKSKKFLFVFLISFSTVFFVKLPIYIYNFDNHKQFTVNRFDTSSGVLLWTLTEDYLVNGNKPSKHQWLSQALIALTNKNRKEFNLPADAKDERSFFNAISQLNSAGRVGNLRHPITNKQLSSKEWGKICKEYWFEINLKNPVKALKRIFNYSGRRVLIEPNSNLHFYRSSPNPNVYIEAIPFTRSPFSLHEEQDPSLKKFKMIKINNLKESDFEVFHPDHQKSLLKSSFLIMKDRGSEKAYLIPEKGLSLFLQSYLRYLPFAFFIIPIFIFSLMKFIKDNSLDDIFKEAYSKYLFEIYLLGSVAVYFFLPILFSSGEPRYRLQFLSFMIIFIACAFRKNDETL